MNGRAIFSIFTGISSGPIAFVIFSPLISLFTSNIVILGILKFTGGFLFLQNSSSSVGHVKFSLNCLISGVIVFSEMFYPNSVQYYSMDCYFRQYWRDKRLSFKVTKQQTNSSQK